MYCIVRVFICKLIYTTPCYTTQLSLLINHTASNKFEKKTKVINVQIIGFTDRKKIVNHKVLKKIELLSHLKRHDALQHQNIIFFHSRKYKTLRLDNLIFVFVRLVVLTRIIVMLFFCVTLYSIWIMYPYQINVLMYITKQLQAKRQAHNKLSIKR